MKIQLDNYKANKTQFESLLQYTPKRKIKSSEVEIDFILTFNDLPQFWFSEYFPKDVSEPEALKALFNLMEDSELKNLIKVSICVYQHGHDEAGDWIDYDNGKRWFNQDINPHIKKPKASWFRKTKSKAR